MLTRQEGGTERIREMAVAGGVHGGHLPSKFRQPPTAMSTRSSHNRALRPQPTAMMSARSNRNRAMRPPPPIFISSNPTHVSPHDLRALYALCNHSCHRFPNVDSNGRVEPVDLHKLRIALSHSSVVVSVFCKPEIVLYYSSFSGFPNSSSESSNLMGVGRDWLQRVVPVTPSNGQLVGFGRAISDSGLTGSIYDVMVIPSLRGMGIGKMIVNRIIRVLTSRGIYDIAALCSEEERIFFKACGFGSDILGSTTMMYTRTISTCEGNQMVKRFGQKLLLAPPVREPF